jgi:GntR family carbon starvation induced transcriptional regulator
MNVEDLHQAIYEEILDGVIPAGKKVHIANLAKRYGVGLSRVREALSRLTATELVIAKTQRGFVVAPLSRKDMEDIYVTRSYIEELALSLSIEKGDAHWEAEAAAAYYRLAQIEKKTTLDSMQSYKMWEKYHREFNVALISACGLQHLLDIQELIYRLTERYRRVWFRTGLKKNKSLLFSSKQKAILDAALARDAKKATGLLRDHFKRARELISKAFS